MTSPTEPTDLRFAAEEPRIRHAARVLILDENDRILMIHFVDDATAFSWWATIGGGLEPGETYEQAARREASEETGLRSVDLGPLVWRREHDYVVRGRRTHQVERFFVARVASFEPVPGTYPGLEGELFRGLRWWTLDELDATSELIAPARLAPLLRDLLESGPPLEPIDAGT